MAQDTQSTQPLDEATNATSTQPGIQVRDLDQDPTGNTSVEQEYLGGVSAPAEAVQEDEAPQDDIRKLIEEQREQIENLKKGLYDKGRELKEVKSTTREEPISEENDSEIAAALDLLKANGVLTRSDLEAYKAEQEQESLMDSISSANPSIDRGLLDDLSRANPNKNIYEVIEMHKGALLGDRVLRKAQGSRPIMGMPIAKEAQREEPKPSDMSDEQFKNWLDSKTQNKGMLF